MVLMRAVCQLLEWFFGLFGYKRDGRFAKCVWGLFATSGAIIMACFALDIVCAGGEAVYKHYFGGHDCDDAYCCHAEYVWNEIYFHNTEDGKGYVYNKYTGEKLIKNVAWIETPLGKDTLVCFSNGEKRGYFSMNTGKVIIEPKYDRAWVFSDGLACVEEDGFIKFIDGTGEVVIDNGMTYNPYMDGYVLHRGYCVVMSDDGERYGLMDKSGGLVIPTEYDDVTLSDSGMWEMRKGKEAVVYDKNMNIVIPLTECSIYIAEGTIGMTMPDHTMRKFDMDGNLIYDFCFSSVRMLEYEKDELKYDTAEYGDIDNTELRMVSYHPMATARLRAYVAGDDYEGLLTADGHIVTKPLYKDISAIGYDLYLCEVSNGGHVIVNGKGETIN